MIIINKEEALMPWKAYRRMSLRVGWNLSRLLQKTRKKIAGVLAEIFIYLLDLS